MGQNQSRDNQDETRPGRDERETAFRIIAQASATAKTGPAPQNLLADLRRFDRDFGDFHIFDRRKYLIVFVCGAANWPKQAVVPT
jgi:hypothetical protein